MRPSLRATVRYALMTMALAAFPSVAHAEPCTAPMPARGTVFSGVVRYIGDGDSLCIGPKGSRNAGSRSA